MHRSILRSWPVFLALFASLLVTPAARAQLEWRVAVHFILDGKGQRPPATFIDSDGNTNSATLCTDDLVRAQIDYGNWVLARTGRGYQMKLVGIDDLANAPAWSDMNASEDGPDPGKDGDPQELADAAADSLKNGPNKFKFRTDAINIYVVGGDTAGSCACGTGGDKPKDKDLIVLSQGIHRDWVILHESGHYLSLQHTHTGERYENDDGSDCNLDDSCDCFRKVAGDDDIADTLPDNECWDTFDQIASANFPTFPSTPLTAAQSLKVSNTLSNIMSYHGSTSAPRSGDPKLGVVTGPAGRSLFTSDQLDNMADASNTNRRQVATGVTVFVDADAPGIGATGSPKPTSLGTGGPHRKLKNGIDDADAGDLVLIRPGSYTEDRLLTKAITLRATRGDATIRAR